MVWRILRLIGVCALGGVAYVGSLAALGFRIKDFSRRSVI